MGGNGDYALTNFVLHDTYLARHTDSTHITTANDKNGYSKGEVATLKWILDRETKRYTYYWNGQLVEENVLAQFSGEDQTPAFKYIRFHISKETLTEGAYGLDSKLYVDNVKVYAVDEISAVTPAPDAEPTVAPVATEAPLEPTPTPTAEPTAAPASSPYIMDADFDNFETGKMVHTLSGEYWNGNLGLSHNHEKGIVVAKNSIDGSASASDRCIEMTPCTSLDAKFYDLPFNFVINEARHYSLGSAVTADKYIVVEFDVAIIGTDAKANGYNIRIGGNGDYALANFRLYDTHLGRYVDSSLIKTENEKNTYTKGTFVHFKWVMDRETKRYNYYWNGQLVESNLLAQFSGADQTPALKYIRFHVNRETLADGATGLDSKLYLDNMRIYVTDSAE